MPEIPEESTRPLPVSEYDVDADEPDPTRVMAPDQNARAAYSQQAAVELDGSMAGPYRLDRVLGRGGGGIVYEGSHSGTSERCAVKVLLPEVGAGPEMLLRFSREIDTLRGLEHPNIVRVLDAGRTENGWPFFAMELLQGETLWQLLKRQQRLSPRECLDLVEPICAAVQAAHGVGIVHRDLKALNVFVHGDPPVIKLLDFGVAKLIRPEDDSENLTTYGTQIGTLDSMSPEQIRCDQVDARTDIYALGVLMYHMLTGHLPFHGLTPEELMRAHLYEPAPRPSWAAPIPPEVDEVVLKCLQKDPGDRFESMDEVLAGLRRAVMGTQGDEPPQQNVAHLAVFVEALEGDGDEELDDEIFELLDEASELLTEAGFEVALELGNSIVALAAVDVGGPTLDVAVDLMQEFARSQQGPVRARVIIHVGEARRTNGQLVGGALADLNAWVPTDSPTGLIVTDEARSLAEAS